MKYSLVGIDGNAFNIMHYVMKAMKESGFTEAEIDDYFFKCTFSTSDYYQLLALSQKMIQECNAR